MKLAELIDLETQLLRDQESAVRDLRERDSRIGAALLAEANLEPATLHERLHGDVALRQRLAVGWLSRLDRDQLPGGRIDRGYRLLSWVLLFFAVLAGAGAARALLAYDGTEPVNVLVFIAVFFVGQLFLLAIGPALLILRSLRRRERLSPWLFDVFARWSRARWVTKLLGDSAQDLPRTLATLSGRRSLYARVEQWTLFALLQRLGVGFNAAALLTCLYLITFTDLAFGWSTTLSVGAPSLHDALGWLAVPWSWFVDATVSSEVVANSQWDRMEKSYVGGGELQAGILLARGEWWPYLVAGLLSYGLIPRIAALWLGSWRATANSKRLRLDHIAFERLFDRLFPRTADWSGPAPDAVRGEPAGAGSGPVESLVARDGRPCWVVCWGRLFQQRDQVTAFVETELGRTVRGVVGAGQADVKTDRDSVEQLGIQAADNVLLLLEAGQQPTKDVMRFLDGIREHCGSQCTVLVSLLAATADGFDDVDPDEQEPWRMRLAAQSDPYLSYEPLQPAP